MNLHPRWFKKKKERCAKTLVGEFRKKRDGRWILSVLFYRRFSADGVATSLGGPQSHTKMKVEEVGGDAAAPHVDDAVSSPLVVVVDDGGPRDLNNP